MIILKVILLYFVGLSASLPATKLELVPKNLSDDDTTKVEVGSTRSDKVEVTVPIKVMTREELITWVTYAMKIMASKINITLAEAEEDPEEMPPERVEKLRNSSVAINQFLDKMNNRERKIGDEISTKMPITFTTEKNSRCKNFEQQLQKLTSTTERMVHPNANEQNKFMIHSSGSSTQTDAQNAFGRPIMDSNNMQNPFMKYIQELALINPYDHTDNNIFRDPNIFPPYNFKQNSYLPLPIQPVHNEENLQKYYALVNGQNFNHTINHVVMTGSQDPMGTMPILSLRNNNHPESSMSVQNTQNGYANSNSGNPSMNLQSTSFSTADGGPLIRVPFEALITITRETSTPATVMSATPAHTNIRHQKLTTKNNIKTKQRVSDSKHEASTSRLPNSQRLPSNTNRNSKKGKNGDKIAVVFEGDHVTPKPTARKKNRKPQPTKRQPSLFGTIIRTLVLPNKNNSTVGGSNVANKISKKNPITRVAMAPYRGKRNETSQKQIDDDDDIDEDDEGNGIRNGGKVPIDDDDEPDEENGNDSDNDEGNDNGVGGGERDIFDDDDDDVVNDDYDYDEGGGSLGSIEDLLPLIIPILEDISDPESETDLVEFLQAAIPLLQGLSERDPETGEGPDIVGVLGPLLQNLSAGKDGMGSDSGAILGPLVQLIAPFIGPLSGPLIGPLSSSSSGGGNKGSSLGALLSAILTPLSTPLEPGGKSPIAGLVANIVAILSKELSAPNSGIDIGALVSQLVTGTLSGTSAGLSGDSSKLSSSGKGGGGDTYGPPPAYGPPAQQIEHFEPPPPNQIPAIFKPPGKSQRRPAGQKLNRARPQATQFRPQATHPETSIVQHKPLSRPPVKEYHQEQVAAPAQYGNTYGVPANTVNPFELLKKALGDILSSGVNLFTAVLGASTASSGASSSSDSDSGGYGPPKPTYGPPKPYQKPDSYQNIH